MSDSEPTTIHDLADLLVASNSVLSSFEHQPWWRGQGVETWRLVPRVFRKDLGLYYEGGIANKFVARAATRYDKCPPRGELAPWLFLMQHYGLPTRLLDWTESPLLAAYFAVSQDEYADEAGALWAIDPFALNGITTGHTGLHQPGTHGVWELFEAAFKHVAADDGKVVALITEEVDVRMMVQMSGVTIHGSREPVEETTELGHILHKFVVGAAAKKKIRDDLASFGIRERAVFPDLEHLASDLTRDRY